MKLISLDIHGFKSFPEATHIKFHEGITAIVGPNGSGKSNISDALLWVLGEQSVKSLRGGKMQDLIFSGTSQRRPLSYAEVVLTLDNSDHQLPLEYETVQICRRLYRSGESEYEINQQKCRLKDVIDLFLDSGLGKNGYSLVGQGRIDELLSARPEDRRMIFDEASGISKYRKRKEEAEKKLAHTEENLLRIQDIQRELSKQLHTLEKQAEVARKYLTLNAQLSSLDQKRLFFELQRYVAVSGELEDNIKLLSADIAVKQQEKDSYLAANSQFQTRQEVLKNELDLAETQANELFLALQDAEKQLELIALNEQQLSKNKEEKLAILAALQAEIDQAQALALQQTEQIQTLERQVSEQTEVFLAKRESLGSNLQKVAEAESLWQSENNKLSRLKQDYWSTHESLAKLQAGKAALEAALKVQLEAVQQLKLQAHKKAEELSAAQKSATQAENLQAELKAALNTTINAYNYSRSKLQELKKESDALEATQATAAYKLRTLQAASENYEGFNQSVKQLLKYIKQRRLYTANEVYGSLADLISIDKEYAYAIDTALGQAIQNIVTNTATTAAELIEILKEQRFGRANFLPLDNLKVNVIDARTLAEYKRLPGFLGLACDLVQVDPAYKAAVDYRLGRILVVKDLATARTLAKLCDRRYQIVTLEGDQISVGGAMSGGEKKQNSTTLLLIERQQEIVKLQADLEKHEAALAELTQAYRSEQQVFASAELALATAKDKLEAARLEQLSQAQTAKQIAEQYQLLEAQLAEKEAAYAAEQSAFANSHSSLVKSLEEHAAQEKKLASLEAELTEQRQTLNKQLAQGSEVQQLIHKEELALNELKNELKLQKELLATTKQQISANEAKYQDNRLLLTLSDTDSAAVIKEQERYSALQSEYKKTLAKANDKVQKLKNELNELEKGNADAFAKLNEIHAVLSRLEGQLLRAQAQAEKEEQKRKNLLQELYENYELSLHDLPSEPITDYVPQRDMKTINNLRAEIKLLLPVNVQAIEQYDELKERYEFIEQQRMDVISAKKELDALISRTTEAMQELFNSSFAVIKENFQDIFAKLFGGGQAEIYLDEKEDVLLGNIEIRVCPPGKRMQNMLLLSGGERCLTAIALLFAIQQLKPSAFCVLDEVEAALDDSNIFRFTEFLQLQAKHTQFILVTHRKGTMEACERIYGVTMQERGVSQVLSLALSEQREKFAAMIE